MFFNRKKKSDEENSCIVPIKYDKKLNIGKLPDGTIVDLFQIVCKDLKNLDDVSNQMDILSWIKLYSTYTDDLKITASFFPVDTSAQIKYFKHVYERTENPILKSAISEEIYKCEAIHEQFLNKEFILSFYSKDIVTYKENYIKIMAMNGNNIVVKEIDAEKKQKYFYLLANKNLNF